MEWLRNIYKLFNIIFPFVDFVYVLQLEEYDTGRYFRWLPKFFLRRGIQQRQRLIYTSRATLILGMSAALFLVTAGWAVLLFELSVALVVLVALVVSIPFIVGIISMLLQPLFRFAHARMRAKALQILRLQRGTTRVVAVAGSYGKTTTKGFIEALARHQYRVQAPLGNINTPAGIASWIIRNLSASTEVLIFEADGYSKEEYVQTMTMLSPDIAIVTNVGDQHLERFGSREALREALTEVFVLAEPNAHLVATAIVAEELRELNIDLGNRKLHAVYAAQPLKYRDTPMNAHQLSASQREDLALALVAADLLDIPERFVLDTIPRLAVPERRQRRGELFGYNAIDDSYNISVSTATASIAAARESAHKEGKKLLVVTAGIPELGPEVADGNKKLGQLLAQNANHTIVLNSMFAKDIVSGLSEGVSRPAEGHRVSERRAEGHGVSSPVLDTSCPEPSGSYTVLPTLSHFETISHTEWPPHEWFLLLLPELNDLYY